MAKKSEDASTKAADKKTKAATAKSAKAAEVVKKQDSVVIPSERRGIRTLVIWLAVVLAIAGISWLTHQESPSDISGAQSASDQIMADFQAGECSKVYAQTTEDFKSRSTEDNWNTQCDVASGVLQGQPESLEVQDDNDEDEAVQLNYRVQGTDDQQYIITTVMVRQTDNSWLLDGLSSQVEPEAAETETE